MSGSTRCFTAMARRGWYPAEAGSRVGATSGGRRSCGDAQVCAAVGPAEEGGELREAGLSGSAVPISLQPGCQPESGSEKF